MIGKGGSQIIELQEMSGCRIAVKRSDASDAAATVEVAGETERKKIKINNKKKCRGVALRSRGVTRVSPLLLQVSLALSY